MNTATAQSPKVKIRMAPHHHGSAPTKRDVANS
jgi:hypothetical protein